MSSVQDETSGLVFTLGGRTEDFAPPETPWLDVNIYNAISAHWAAGLTVFFLVLAKISKLKETLGKFCSFSFSIEVLSGSLY